MKHREALLEAGLLIALMSLLGGAALAVLARAAAGSARTRVHGQPPPRSGTVPAQRHHNVSTSAAR